MTVFGTTLDPTQIASIVGLLATLVLWLFVLRGERNYARRFRNWEAARKARRDAELGVRQDPQKKTGPWG